MGRGWQHTQAREAGPGQQAPCKPGYHLALLEQRANGGQSKDSAKGARPGSLPMWPLWGKSDSLAALGSPGQTNNNKNNHTS